MKTKFLRLRTALRAVMLVLLIGVVGITKGFAEYDFSAVCPSGQTLYYRITDVTNHYVSVVYPGSSSSDPWDGYQKPLGNIVIPNTVEYWDVEYMVTEIGYRAFYGCSDLTSVTIPNSMTSIEQYSFSGCSGLTTVYWNAVNVSYTHCFLNFTNLSTVVFGDSVERIPGSAFGGCSGLTSLTISNSVTSIGESAFNGCSGLTSLTIGNSVTSIEDNAFYACYGLTSVYYTGDIGQWCQISFNDYDSNPLYYSHNIYINNELVTDLVIPDTVTEIKDYAFCDCSSLTSLTIGNSVTSIGYQAFSGCSGLIGSLTIPNSVTSISDYAFYGCSGLTTVYWNAVNIIGYLGYNTFQNCTNLSMVVFGDSVETIPGDAFYGCSGLTSLTLGNSVTNIGNWAFDGCSGLTSLTIPNSVTSIGYQAFSGCSGLIGSLTIPNSVTSIGEYAFSGCSGLTTVYWNAVNVTSYPNFNRNPFSDCTNLSTVVFGDSVERIPTYAFRGCSGLTTVYWNSVNVIGYSSYHDSYSDIPWLFENCTNLSTVVFGDSVETIPANVFNGCGSGLTSLTIGSSVTSIGRAAFAGCSGLTSLTIPNSVTSIGENAFEGCSGLTSLTIPNSVTDIGKSAFFGCSGLTSLTIPNSVTSISDYAFKNCSGLTTVYWDAVNVTNYESGYSTFENCTNLNTVVFGDAVERIPSGAFSGFSSLTSLTIGNSVTDIGGSAFWGCIGLTSLTIPNSVTSIGYQAFSGCIGLTSLTIPNSVTSIGYQAFSGCSGLIGSLTIPDSVTSIGEYAFSGCSGLTLVTIGNSVTSIGFNAFDGCSGLATVYWNAVNVTSYPSYYNYKPFENCTNLSTVVFGDSVETIPSSAFSGCSGLTTLTIGNSVTNIGDYAFSGCSGIVYIRANCETCPVIYQNTFNGIDKSILVFVPCGTSNTYQANQYWSEFENIYETEYGLVVIQNDEYGGEASVLDYADCEDNNCTILAEPSVGYTFNGWYVNDEFVTGLELYDCSLTEDAIFEARFARNENHYIANGTSNTWSNPDTWDNGDVPTESSTVAIYKNIVVDVDANVSALGIYDDNSITVYPSVVLTVEDELVSNNSSSIVIEDGGQIIHSNEDVMATIKKTIEPIASDDDGWNLISYSLKDNGTVASVTNILSNEYDLFAYDEPSYTWLNQKNENHNFTELEAGMGYLYANSGKAVDNPMGTKIGAGTSTISYTPFYTYYNYSLSENLFLASELEAAGHSTSEIGALCWYATNETGYQQNNISIWMANVSDSELSSTSHNVSEMTLVYTGGMTPVIGWNEFVFNENTFTWDGTNNVLICVQRNNGVYNSAINWQAHNPGFAALSYKYNDGSAYDMTAATYSMTVSSSSRPNTIFQTVEQVGKFENYEPTTISFAGEIANGTAEITVPLSYTSGNTLSGFNLVGNPYAHNVTSYEGYNVANGCYRLNDAKTNLIISMVSEEDPLKVGEGFFVKAIGNGASVTFNSSTRNTDDENGLVCLEINKNDRTVDRVYLQINEGEGLDKMVLPNHQSLLYFVDGRQPMAILPHHAKAYYLFFDAAENGTFTIESKLLGTECEYLHLIDRITGGDIDLLSTPSYSFEAKKSDIANRFALVFAEGEQPEAVTEVEPIREIVPVLPPHGSDNDEPAGSQTAVTQTISLVAGTNWVSFNVEITLDDLKAALVAASPNAAITIKSQTQKATYNPSNGRWTGRLTTFDLSQMYKITVSTACEITLEGVRINPAEHPVTITPGANWIAYPLNTSKTPQEVFTGFAVPGDMVKSQSQKKQYNSNGRWTGQLGSLEPGQGYIYTSSATEDRVFTFPMSTE